MLFVCLGVCANLFKDGIMKIQLIDCSTQANVHIDCKFGYGILVCFLLPHKEEINKTCWIGKELWNERTNENEEKIYRKKLKFLYFPNQLERAEDLRQLNLRA